MTNEQFMECYRASAGTYANITGLGTNDEIAKFTNWMHENKASLKWRGNLLATIGEAWFIYDCDQAEQDTDQDSDQADAKQGMSVEESKQYLATRGLESLVPGGFSTIQAMQQRV